MALDEIKFVGGLIMTVLFCMTVLFWIIAVQIENNASSSITGQPGFNDTLEDLSSNLTVYRTNTINATDSFYQSELDIENVKTGGQFKLGPSNALKSADNVAKQGFTSIFGSDANFGFLLATLMTFLLFVVGLLVWKTWKGGNPG